MRAWQSACDHGQASSSLAQSLLQYVALAAWVLPNACYWCPRPDSNRHDLATEGFSYHFGFRRRPLRLLDVRGLEHAFTLAVPSLALGARRLLSTPSRRCLYPTGLVRCQLDQLGDMVRAFADFDGCHPGRFPPGAQFLKSLVSTNFTTRACAAPCRAGSGRDYTILDAGILARLRKI